MGNEMKPNRIIISSRHLYEYLKECVDKLDAQSEDEFIMYCERDSISIPTISERYVSCEASEHVWYFKFDYNKLNRFCKVLKYLEEQPITLVFDDGYVKISCAVI